MWSILGTCAALALTLLALVRSRKSGGYYDAGVYGMTPRAHRVYAAFGLFFSAAFLATLVFRAETAAIAVFAFFTLVAVFYITSFLRGFSDDQE